MAGWKRGNGDSREWDKEEFSGMKKNVRRGRGQRGGIGEWLRRRSGGRREEVVRKSAMLARVGR